MDKMPANYSYIVLVHGGAFKNFLEKLGTKLPELHIKYLKKIAIHYYVIQLECNNEKPVDLALIKNLPVMAFRDEFSSYIFFNNLKPFQTTLKRMCLSKEEDESALELINYMLSPWEKVKLLNINEKDDLEIAKVEGKITKYSMFSGADILKSDSLQKIFETDAIKINGKEKNVIEELKGSPEKWTIGIC